MGEFNVGSLLRLGAAKLGPKLGELAKSEVRKLLTHEQAQGVKARTNMVQLLQAELEGRAGELEEASVLLIARAAHAMNAAYCRSIGDDSQPDWEDAPDWQRDSAVLGVKFHLANPLAGPDASHASWYAQKEADGWTFGEVKDPEKKTHPCMVAFEDLPTEQQAKDTLFRQVVHTLVPIFNVMEDMAERIDELSGAVPREQVGPGAIAELRPPEDGAEQAKLLERVVELAFCEGRDVMFKIAAEGADFIAGLGKVAFGKAVTLKRDKPRVRIDQVVALDAEGRPIARCRMMQPLEGGGGRQALFPARSISFDL